ncbi:unnamed protein product [Schistosoma rodhaini]|uniref:Uncharacterized protein n=1 Tax=Schistosoma rodhaini TaxID=6188 RepID=A0AA85G9Y3_9TREM|nr:unnamed protein product [Schistosoma rodhaini]
MPWIGAVVLPYRHGTTEELQRILRQHRINVHYKTTNTLRNTLVRLKEKIPFMPTQNCVYKLGCVDCDAFYNGESSREILTRAKEHIRYTKKPPNNNNSISRNFQQSSN